MPSTVSVGHMPTDIWFDRTKVEEEEYRYQVYLAKQKGHGSGPKGVAQQIAQAREQIHQTLKNSDAGLSSDGAAKLKKLEDENVDLRKIVNTLVQRMSSLESRLTKLEGGSSAPEQPSEPTKETKAKSDDDDSDIDLFGSDDDDDGEAERLRQERLAAYAAKKAKKPAITAKSNIILDVKPWDDETDMEEVEKAVRSIETDGLLWGASKFAEVAYGITKLVICCVVEDDKVGTDFLEEEIKAFKDLVQSVDIAAFNKI